MRVELSYVLEERIEKVPVAGITMNRRRFPMSLVDMARGNGAKEIIAFPKPRERYKWNGIYQEIDAFIDSIVNDTTPPVTPEEGRELMRVSGLIWDAVEAGE